MCVLQGPVKGGGQMPIPCPLVLPDMRDILPMTPSWGANPQARLQLQRL